MINTCKYSYIIRILKIKLTLFTVVYINVCVYYKTNFIIIDVGYYHA